MTLSQPVYCKSAITHHHHLSLSLFTSLSKSAKDLILNSSLAISADLAVTVVGIVAVKAAEGIVAVVAMVMMVGIGAVVAAEAVNIRKLERWWNTYEKGVVFLAVAALVTAKQW